MATTTKTNMIRPTEWLNSTVKSYPRMPALVETMREGRGKDLPEWPEWCFVPMAGWYAMVSEANNVSRLSIDMVEDVAKLSAIGTWRYSQGVYQVDPDLMTGLTESQVKGSLPSEVLYRLPEWCVYVETPGQQFQGLALHGFWAHLEWDVNTGRVELRFLLDCGTRLIAWPLHLGAWTITEAVDRAAKEAVSQSKKAGAPMKYKPDDVQTIAGEINPLVSILLYLCSDEPEIDNDREPGSVPSRPQAQKTKKGWRLFPPDKPKLWSVGKEIGEKLREASAGSGNGGTVKTHLRRGHWHGYWTGPRKGERKFKCRWISPLVVSGRDDKSDNLD